MTRTISLESLEPPSGIYVIPASGNPLPVVGVGSGLPRHDVLLLSIPHEPQLRTLPLSPYPAPNDSAISVRLFSSPDQPELQTPVGQRDWQSWLDGYALRTWVTGGKVLGYRDLAGRESKVSALLGRASKGTQ